MSGDFKTGWKVIMPKIIEKQKGSDHPCRSCKITSLCGYCPAFVNLEQGSEEVFSDYLCSLGKYRFEAICNDQ
jgi:radical SAM protein with 4Fe4S-binding SPASM domain